MSDNNAARIDEEEIKIIVIVTALFGNKNRDRMLAWTNVPYSIEILRLPYYW